MHPVPVMPGSQGEVHAGREIINARKNGNRFRKITEAYDRVSVSLMNEGITALVVLVLAVHAGIEGKPVAETVAQAQVVAVVSIIGSITHCGGHFIIKIPPLPAVGAPRQGEGGFRRSL